MMKLIVQLFRYLIHALTRRMSGDRFSQLVITIVEGYLRDKTPRESLKALFALDARLYAKQGQLAVSYDGGIHTKHRHIRYHDFFIGRIKGDDYVMDIGCGIGAVAYDVAKVAARVVGIDIDSESIRQACELYNHPNLEFRVGDALKPMPDEKYSVVILSNVLEHLPGRPAFLRRVQETLKPRSILIRVPLFERDWRVPLKKELGVEWRLDTTHETEYTLESFMEEMKAADMTIKQMEVRWGEIWAEVGTKDS